MHTSQNATARWEIQHTTHTNNAIKMWENCFMYSLVLDMIYVYIPVHTCWWVMNIIQSGTVRQNKRPVATIMNINYPKYGMSNHVTFMFPTFRYTAFLVLFSVRLDSHLTNVNRTEWQSKKFKRCLMWQSNM